MKKCLFFLIVLFTTVSLAQADLIAHYSMEVTGGAIVDQVGGETAEPVDAGHSYVRTGPPTWGNAVGLTDNASWQLDVTESAELNSLTNNYTVAAWVYVDSALRLSKSGLYANNDRIIGDDIPWDGDAWSLGVRDGTVILTKNGVADVHSSVAVTEDQWVHVAVVASSATGVEFYLNGVLTQTIGNTANNNVGDDVFAIGRSYGNEQAQWFPGMLDEIKVYDNALTAPEIAELITGPSTRAILVAPTAGSMTVNSATAEFEWSAPGDIVPAAYNLYYRADDPNWSDTTSNIVITDAVSPQVSAAILLSDTTYYWRVDSLEPNGIDFDVHEGTTWNFTTAPAVPYVLTDPTSQTAAMGTDVTLTVDAINVDSYQWYRDGEEIIGQTLAALVIIDIQASDEGDYLCKLTNIEGSVDSASARILTERLFNNWQLDGNMVDSVSGNDGQGFGSDPNYTTGVDGSDSVILYGNNAVQIPNDPDMNFEAFTVSLWTKVDGGAGHRAAISNRDDAPQRGFIIYAMPGNTWSFWTGTGAGWNQLGSVPIVNGEWVHLVASVDTNGVKKLYANGLLAAETEAGYLKNSDQDLLIGAGKNEAPANYYFDGQIDDVQLYNYAINPIDVAILYTGVIEGDICYEFPEFDLNEDCYVNLSDFAIMASNWLECNLVPADNCL